MAHNEAVSFRSMRFREQCAGRRAHESEMGTWPLRHRHSGQSMLKDGNGCGLGGSEQRTKKSHRHGRQEVAVSDLLVLPHDRAVEALDDTITSTCQASPQAVSWRLCVQHA